MEPVSENVVPVVAERLDVRDIAAYFVFRDAEQPEPDVTPMKLQKLLYFSQGHYLAATGRRLFDEPVEAFEHGPVVYRVWHQYPGRAVIAATSSETHAVHESLPSDVEEFLAEVWNKYRGKSATALRNLTHRQKPWCKNYIPKGFRTEIPDSDLRDYFRHDISAADKIAHRGVVIVPRNLFDDWDDDAQAVRIAEEMMSRL